MKATKNYLTLMSKLAVCLSLLCLCMTVGMQRSSASHLAGGSITYTYSGNNVYHVTLFVYRDCAGINLGATQNLSAINTCTNANVGFTVSQVGAPLVVSNPCAGQATTCNGGAAAGIQKWQYEGNVTLSAGCSDWRLSWTLNARNGAITTLQNAAAQNMYIEAHVNTITNNNSAQYSIEPILFLCNGQLSCVSMGASDVTDHDSLSFDFACALSAFNTCIPYVAGYSATNPINSTGGVTLDHVTGNICMNPTSTQVGVMVVLVTEWRTINGTPTVVGKTMRDMQVYTQPCTNNLPTLSGLNNTSSFSDNIEVTPTCYDVFSNDIDAGQLVTLTLNNPGNYPVTMSSAGSPHPTGHICVTPTAANIGQTFIFSVTVKDNACPTNGVQVLTYSIHITADPIFDAPASGSTICIETGQPYSVSILAHTPDTSVNVHLTAATIPATATLNPALPTPLTNDSTSTVLSWTPTCSNWGINALSFTATDALGHTKNLSFNLLVNSAPSFTSSPNLGPVLAGQLYSYSIVTSDPDLGCSLDALTISGVLPGWLTLVDNGNGTATLSGIPAGTDAGSNPVSLLVSDTYNQCYAPVTQAFNIEVINCTPPVFVSCPGDLEHPINVCNDQGLCGAVVNYSSAVASGTPAPTITYSQNSGTFFPVGSTTVTATASNGCGNNSDATCTFTVTVRDCEAPTINCTSSITIPNDAGHCYGTVLFPSNMVLQYDPTGPQVSGTPNAPSFQASGFSGSNLSQVGLQNFWNNTNVWPVGQITSSAGISLGDYLTFNVSVPSGTDLARLQYTKQSYFGTGATSASVRSSLDGFASDISMISVNPAGAQELIFDLTSMPFVSGNVSFRIYFWGAPVNLSDWDDLVSTTAGGSGLRLFANSLATASDNCSASVTYTNFSSNYQYPSGTTTITATATDPAGHTASCSYDVTVVIPSLSFFTATEPILCNGGTGTIIVSGTGGVAPYLGTGSHTLTAGTYSYTITDACGSTVSTGPILLPEPTAVSATCRGTNISCRGAGNGAVSVAASGGTVGYSYSWSNGNNTSSISNLGAGNYCVTVTDHNGCTASCCYTVTEPSALTVTCSGTNVLCNGARTGSASVAASGGTPSYSYSWSNGGQGSSISNISAGTYCVTVIDNNGCSRSCCYTVTQPSAITAYAGPDEDTYFGYTADQVVTHTITPTGGVGPYTYTWTLVKLDGTPRGLKCNQTNTSGDESFVVTGGSCGGTTTCPASGTTGPSPVCTASGLSSTVTVLLLDTGKVCVTVKDANLCTVTSCFEIRATDVRCFSGNSGITKVTMCHRTGSPTNPWVQICVDQSAVAALLANGDYLGTCSVRHLRGEGIDNAGDDNLVAYPNPTSNQLNILFNSSKTGDYTLQLIDMTGQLVMNQVRTAVEGNNTIDLYMKNYAKGIYTLSVTNGEGSRQIRVVVE